MKDARNLCDKKIMYVCTNGKYYSMCKFHKESKHFKKCIYNVFPNSLNLCTNSKAQDDYNS